MQLNPLQVDAVADAIAQRGTHLVYTKDELLDHLCCMVEERMVAHSFESALQQCLELFPAPEWKKVEAMTHQLLIHTKLKTMNNTLRISGILSAMLIFTGTFFKIMHWPGASIMAVLGMVIMAMLFLPLYFIIRHKTAGESNRNIVLSVSGALTGVCIVAGILFKMQHWPGANMLMYSGTGILLLGYLPVYLLTVYRKSLNRVQALSTVVLIVAAGSTLLLANTRGPSMEMKKNIATVVLEQQNQVKDQRSHLFKRLHAQKELSYSFFDATAFDAILVSVDSLKRAIFIEAGEPANNYLAVGYWDRMGPAAVCISDGTIHCPSLHEVKNRVKAFNEQHVVKLHIPIITEYASLPLGLAIQKLTLQQSRWILECEMQL